MGTSKRHSQADGPGCLWLLLACLHVATAQQPSPLMGQGLDPVTANVTSTPVPVYVSVILERVLSIDETAYRFEVSLTALVTWTDPRAEAQFQVSKYKLLKWEEERTVATKQCQEASEKQSKNWTALCDRAAELAKAPDCTRPCDLNYEGSLCCDGVWIPDISFLHVVGFSQDRVVSDAIEYLGNSSWVRGTQINGLFSDNFDFQRFPFDTQVLSVPISVDNPSSYYLVPSLLARTVPGYLTVGVTVDSSTEQDEVTGWKTVAVNVSCAEAGNSSRNSTRMFWRDFDEGDPILGALRPAENQSVNGNESLRNKNRSKVMQASVCVLEIYVQRLSFYYVWMDIFPGIIITVISFSVFFTDPTAIDVRLGTVVTLFLALVAVQFIIVDQLPKTSYLTAFCAVIVASYVILFIIVVEAVLVHYVSSLTHFRQSKGIEPTSTRKALAECDPQPLLADVKETDPADDEGVKAVQRHPDDLANASPKRDFVREEPSREMRDEVAEPRTEAKAGKLRVASFSEPECAAEKRVRPLRREGSMFPSSRKLHNTMVEVHTQLAENPQIGYRVACYIDLICGPSLFLAYVICVLVIFLKP